MAIVPEAVKASPSPTVFVWPSKASGKVDGNFTVYINVSDVDDLYSISVYLTWDTSKMGYNYRPPVGTDPGGGPDVNRSSFFQNYIATTPESDSVFLVVKGNQTEGWLDIATGLLGSATGVPGPTGGSVLLISFRVFNVGTTPITIQTSKMLDHFPNEIAHTRVSGLYRSGDLAGPLGIKGDGVVDIWDLTYVGLEYGKSVSQKSNPTTWAAAAGGGWANPGDAATSNNIYATSATSLQAEAYYTYGFNTGVMNVITKVLVGVEFHEVPFNSTEADFVYIYVSNNAGVSYSTYKYKLTPQYGDSFMWADMTAAYAWTPTGLTDANFRVKIEYRKIGLTADIISLDWIPVKVEYTQTTPLTNPGVDVSGNGLVDAMDLAAVAQGYGA